ncbi:MAG: 5-bromo-4-chloroindolyl phosphate hydrolysis family protein [Phaeovulum sp.]|uniref:5-bromo-4-chloroindolyl phosphate hydrolysis family protein n=1 Tax=Phaeovulum sp. TaxID=2934796 RepID=UPI00272FCCA1|nr:5-bromo-4-chloroindolyl phosphate hydrolysis family protein [Phaeovulum sp.]MDP2062970.1 5-bromo-4-chloroindolyl phosphate hydrolysis family protein [Phaeovulum sp.]
MAERFGGKFSPEPHSPGTTPTLAAAGPEPRHPLAARPIWLVVAAAPFLVSAFSEPPAGLAMDLAAFAAFAAAAFVTREGLRAEAAFNARRVARRPAFPRKALGAVLVGAGLWLGSFAPGAGLFGPIILAALGIALHLVAFGLDPMRDKGMEGIDAFQQDRVARVVGEGEKLLAGMRDAILRARDKKLEARVERFSGAARTLFRAVEDDPRDLTAARKYMGVYLMGARDATARFADLYGTTRDAKARADYEALLADLETNFAAQTRELIENGRENLDIEIEVLRDRLAREGVPSPSTVETK